VDDCIFWAIYNNKYLKRCGHRIQILTVAVNQQPTPRNPMKNILALAAQITPEEIVFPKEETIPGKKVEVLGTLPPELKKLWGLYAKMGKESEEEFEKLNAELGEKQKDLDARLKKVKNPSKARQRMIMKEIPVAQDFAERAAATRCEHQSVGEIFWTLVKIHFGITQKLLDIGILSKGVVVCWKSKVTTVFIG